MDYGDSRTAWTDEPIRSIDEDQLGFGLFAEQLANEAIGWTKSPKVVAALTGPWGSGKTSIVNLAIPHLERADVRPLRFDPWLFSTHLDLATALLSQIAVTVGANRKKKRELFQDFLKYTAVLGLDVTSDALSGGVWGRVRRGVPGILAWGLTDNPNHDKPPLQTVSKRDLR